MNISWVDKITNIEVIRSEKAKRTTDGFQSERGIYIGDIFRGECYKILKLIIAGKHL